MATKLTFWDTHNAEEPEEYTICKDRYLKAVYILDDTWDGETVGEYDYGIFNCGFGDNTLNKENRFGKSWKTDWPTTPQGYAYKHPVAKVRNGVTEYQHVKKLRYPDKLQWVIHKERDGSVWLYKPQLLQSDGCSSCYGRGEKAYDVTGWSFSRILDNCRRDGFNGAEVVRRMASEEKTRPIGPRIPIAGVFWSKELDGKSIVILLARYPKMTYKEILMVIEGEGGSVDGNGIIHKKSE